MEYLTSVHGVTCEQLQGFCVGWRQPLTPAQLHQILENSSYIVLALDKASNRVIGFINALSDEVNFAFIPMLEVLPPYQKRGIGSELVRRMLAQLEHITCIDLMCDSDMQPFYERFGMLRSHGMVIRKYL
jgi:ribosomal protein S18 acetylase RimI-like enzyme